MHYLVYEEKLFQQRYELFHCVTICISASRSRHYNFLGDLKSSLARTDCHFILSYRNDTSLMLNLKALFRNEYVLDFELVGVLS